MSLSHAIVRDAIARAGAHGDDATRHADELGAGNAGTVAALATVARAGDGPSCPAMGRAMTATRPMARAH